MCSSSKEVRDWVCRIIHNTLKVQFNDFEDILSWDFDLECPRQKTVSWLAVHYIAFCVQKHPKISLFVFKKSIREFRWNQKEKVKKNIW